MHVDVQLLSVAVAIAALVIGGFVQVGGRISDLDRRMARIEGLLEAWLSGAPRPSGTQTPE